MKQAKTQQVQKKEKLTVKKMDSIGSLRIEKISSLMDNFSKEKLKHFYFTPDTDKNYRPEVFFSMAHDNKNIVLKFFVEENYILAAAVKDNESVCTDSCVEFFTVPGGGAEKYYNFEFNCIGTCLSGHGRDRHDWMLLDPKITGVIKRYSSLGQTPFPERKGDFKWEITVIIPSSVFQEEGIASLSGKEFYANFYKCGDKLTKPHWISWAKEEVPVPDFHRPEFFEKILFE